MSEVPLASFLIPTPPSVNNLFVNLQTGRVVGSQRRARGGRIKTPDYRAWLAEAGWQINIQRVPKLGDGPFRVVVEVPCFRNRDLDNTLKPILDLITRQGLWADDCWADDIRVVRTKPPGSTRVTVFRL